MDEEEAYELQQHETRYNIVKWAAGIVGFLAVMGLFIWVTVPPPPPELAPMVRVSSLSHGKQLAPGSKNRLIFVGDVHGMHKELQKLLKKVDFDAKNDQLVLLGDFISKGPESLAVLEDAIRYNAACVRGNHEDELLEYYAHLRGIHEPLTYPPNALVEPATFGAPVTATLDPTTGVEWEQPTALATATPETPFIGGEERLQERLEESDIFRKEIGDDDDFDEELDELFPAAITPLLDETRDRPLTMHLEPRHIRYLEQCPGILKLGQVRSDGGHGVAVHGGLLWNEPNLEKQRPEVIFRLRSLLPPEYVTPSDDEGKPWARFFNAGQKKIENPKDRLTVFYGHDASRGLKLRKYTKGLDSRCVKGGRLTAMVKSMTNHGKVRTEVVSVKCSAEYE